jgi:hypothetical protein
MVVSQALDSVVVRRFPLVYLVRVNSEILEDSTALGMSEKKLVANGTRQIETVKQTN